MSKACMCNLTALACGFERARSVAAGPLAKAVIPPMALEDVLAFVRFRLF